MVVDMFSCTKVYYYSAYIQGEPHSIGRNQRSPHHIHKTVERYPGRIHLAPVKRISLPSIHHGLLGCGVGDGGAASHKYAYCPIEY